MAERLRAGGLHGSQSVDDDGGQDLDHLAIAIVAAGELAPHAFDRSGQHPILEDRIRRRSACPDGGAGFPASPPVNESKFPKNHNDLHASGIERDECLPNPSRPGSRHATGEA